MTTLLYIEDDEEIGEMVRSDLEGRGYRVVWLKSGEQASANVKECRLAILDVMLPGLDGFTIGQRLKKDHPSLPILMLSARTSIDDKLQGLDFADDYVTKPFHPDELAARIEVLLRRHGETPAGLGEIHIGHLLVKEQEGLVLDTRNQQEILLSGKQFHIFSYFVRHLGQIRTKEQIYESVWGESYIEGDKTLMVHIRHLREKLEIDPGMPRIIETVRGVGYRVKG